VDPRKAEFPTSSLFGKKDVEIYVSSKGGTNLRIEVKARQYINKVILQRA